MTVKEIFETMEYGPAPESAADALAWIESRGGVAGHFIGGTGSCETISRRAIRLLARGLAA